MGQNVSNPRVTVKESWKPTSNKDAGLAIKSIAATRSSNAILSASQSSNLPINAKVSIKDALRTGGPSPVISV